MVTAAHIFPSPQKPDLQDGKENEKVQCKSAQADLSKGEIKQEETDPEDILQKVDLSGIADWDSTVQQETHNLICDYACIFLWNDLDLGKTSIIKHSIKLTDPTSFKECYRGIPPGMYEEVKPHMQGMLDVGAIQPSNSPWASAVVLVQKKDGKLRFCIDPRRLNAQMIKDTYTPSPD